MKNIVFILMDQLRSDFLGCYGAKHLKTPNIDQLAKESIIYEQAISPSPICVPARASLLTGKSSMENRVMDNNTWLRPDHDKMGIHTWPYQLSKKGYYTAAIGKMHFYPWDISEGFNERVIAEDKRHIHINDDYTKYLKSKGLKRLHGNEHEGYHENKGAIISKIPDMHQIDKFVADKACQTISTLKKNKPFALMIGIPGPHCPYDPSLESLNSLPEVDVPQPIKATSDSNSFRDITIKSNKSSWNGVDYTDFTEEQKVKIRKHYSASIQKIDEYIGNIISKLKEQNLYEDTVIILSSDHGDLLGDFDLIGKHVFYENSIRIPLMIKHPDYKGSCVSETVSLTDIYSTILEFADIKSSNSIDSVLLSPFRKESERPAVFGATDIGWMLRNDIFKLTISNNGNRELYNILEDTTEQNNLYKNPEYSDIKMNMENELFGRMFYAINNGSNDNIVTDRNIESGFFEPSWKRVYPSKGVKEF